MTSYKLCFLFGVGEDKNDISWLTGSLIWSFCRLFLCVKLNKTGGFHDESFLSPFFYFSSNMHTCVRAHQVSSSQKLPQLEPGVL